MRHPRGLVQHREFSEEFARAAELEVPLQQLGLQPDTDIELEDLLSGERRPWRGARQEVRFDPAERVGYIWRVIRDGGGAG